MHYWILTCLLIVNAQAQDPVALAKKVVHQALNKPAAHQPPPPGPTIKLNQNIVAVVGDMRNEGHEGVVLGMIQAARNIKWQIKPLDGQGTVKHQRKAFAQALDRAPDGIALIGIDVSHIPKLLKKAKRKNIPVVAWNAGDIKQNLKDLIFASTGTNPVTVAKLAAQYAIAHSDGKAQVVIITDSTYAIALKKADVIKSIIETCKTCKVLEVIDLPIAQAKTKMQSSTKALLKRHKKNLNYIIAINDYYFNFVAPALRAGSQEFAKQIHGIAAGDGSSSAYRRIYQTNLQIATVPSAINMEGWQIIDEINRALKGEMPSLFQISPALVTKKCSNLIKKKHLAITYEPANGYREAYARYWLGD